MKVARVQAVPFGKKLALRHHMCLCTVLVFVNNSQA